MILRKKLIGIRHNKLMERSEVDYEVFNLTFKSRNQVYIILLTKEYITEITQYAKVIFKI